MTWNMKGYHVDIELDQLSDKLLQIVQRVHKNNFFFELFLFFSSSSQTLFLSIVIFANIINKGQPAGFRSIDVETRGPDVKSLTEGIHKNILF